MSKDGMINIGCLGCGGHGLGNNYQKCFDNPLIHIRAMCDLKPDLLRKGAEMYQPDYTTENFHDMLDDPQIDAILVITADTFHAPLSIDCLHGGKHVFVEKPMARTLEECHDMIQAVRDTGRKLMVGTNRRFAPAYVDLKQKLERASVSPELEADHKPPLIYYRIVDDPRNASPRLLTDKAQGGRLNEEVCHIYDLFHFFIGSEPRRIFASGDAENRGVIQIEYENGAVGVIFEGGMGHIGYTKEYMEVCAHGVQAVVDFFHELRFVSDDLIERRYYESSGPPDYRIKIVEESDVIDRHLAACRDTAKWALESGLYRAVSLEDRDQRWRQMVADGNTRPAGTDPPFVDKGHYGEHEAFRRAIVDDTPSPISEVDGARAFVMGRVTFESMRSRKPVEVDQSLYLR